MRKLCPFCDRAQLESRVFFESDSWFAFLAAPYNARGHAILAAKGSEEICPVALERGVLHGFDNALVEVAAALQQHYRPKDILCSSLRGDVKHVHFHAIPLWEADELSWREQCQYGPGHLLEFLGHLEKRAYIKTLVERLDRNWSEEDQRRNITAALQPDVSAIRAITGYG